MLHRFLTRLLASLLCIGLAACSSLTPRDPLHIDLVGLEPQAGQGMEMRFVVVLRVQNPNDNAIYYNGVALDLEVNGQPLASGVSADSGQVPRFGEALVRIPLSVSTFSLVRQAWAASGYRQGQNLPYRLNGKLADGLFGTVRFNASGTLNWPEPASTP